MSAVSAASELSKYTVSLGKVGIDMSSLLASDSKLHEVLWQVRRLVRGLKRSHSQKAFDSSIRSEENQSSDLT